jgi:hypothetical protein
LRGEPAGRILDRKVVQDLDRARGDAAVAIEHRLSPRARLWLQRVQELSINLPVLAFITGWIEAVQAGNALGAVCREQQRHAEIIAGANLEDAHTGNVVGLQAGDGEIVVEDGTNVTNALFDRVFAVCRARQMLPDTQAVEQLPDGIIKCEQDDRTIPDRLEQRANHQTWVRRIMPRPKGCRRRGGRAPYRRRRSTRQYPAPSALRSPPG